MATQKNDWARTLALIFKDEPGRVKIAALAIFCASAVAIAFLVLAP